jgi:hypothetical protein
MMKEDVAQVLFEFGFAKASLKIWVAKIKVLIPAAGTFSRVEMTKILF